MSEGWIVLHRKLVDWEWYTDLPVKTLFLHCLLKANYVDKKWRGEIIKRGEFISSLGTLAEESGLSLKQVRTALSKLKMTGDLLSQGTAYTKITIYNYSAYQDKPDCKGTEMAQERHKRGIARAQKRQMKGTQRATTKQINNINKENNYNNKNKIKTDSLKHAEEAFLEFWKTTQFPKRPQDDKASMKKKYLNLVLKEKMNPDDILISSNKFAEANRGNEFSIGMRKFLQKETVEQYLNGDYQKQKTIEDINLETMNELFEHNRKEIVV